MTRASLSVGVLVLCSLLCGFLIGFVVSPTFGDWLATTRSHSWRMKAIVSPPLAMRVALLPSSKQPHSARSDCSCLMADTEQLINACAFQPSGWPANSAQKVTRCMQFLAHNQSQYLTPAHEQDCRKPLVLHTFWTGDLSWKFKLTIEAFLFTHYAKDAACKFKPVLYVWLQTRQDIRCVLTFMGAGCRLLALLCLFLQVTNNALGPTVGCTTPFVF